MYMARSLLKEISLLRQLNKCPNPYTLAVYDVLISGKQVAIVMEYIPYTLEDFMDQSSRCI